MTELIYFSRISVWIIDCKSVVWYVLFCSVCFASTLYYSTCLLSQMVSDSVSLMWFVVIWLSIKSRFLKHVIISLFMGLDSGNLSIELYSGFV